MQQAHSAANSALQTGQRSSCSNGTSGTDSQPKHPLSGRALDEFWLMMLSRYGHPWENQCGSIPEGIAAVEWGTTLAGVTWQQIMQGMEADKLRASAWPPSSTEFLAMCRPPQRVQEWKSQKRIGHYTPGVADSAMAKCRAMLGIKETAP